MKKIWLVCFLISTPLFASGKVLQPGFTYFGYSAAFSEADIFFRAEKETDYPYNTYLGHHFFLALAPINRVNLFTTMTYVQTREPSTQTEENAFSDWNIGLKFGLLKQKSHFLSVAIAGELKQPVTDYVAGGHTSIGDAQRDYSFKVEATREFQFFVYQFVNILGGYRIREETPEDQYFLGAEYGFYLFGLMGISTFLKHTQAVSGPDFGELGSTTINTKIVYTIWGFKVAVYPIKSFLLEFNYSQAIRVRNTLLFRNLGIHLGYLQKIF